MALSGVAGCGERGDAEGAGLGAHCVRPRRDGSRGEPQPDRSPHRPRVARRGGTVVQGRGRHAGHSRPGLHRRTPHRDGRVESSHHAGRSRDGADRRADARGHGSSRQDGRRRAGPGQPELASKDQALVAQGAALATEREEAEKRAAQAAADIAKFASIKQESRGMVITLSGSVLFTSGKSELLPAAQLKLNDVATALTEQDPESTSMVVEGPHRFPGRGGVQSEAVRAASPIRPRLPRYARHRRRPHLGGRLRPDSHHRGQRDGRRPRQQSARRDRRQAEGRERRVGVGERTAPVVRSVSRTIRGSKALVRFICACIGSFFDAPGDVPFSCLVARRRGALVRIQLSTGVGGSMGGSQRARRTRRWVTPSMAGEPRAAAAMAGPPERRVMRVMAERATARQATADSAATVPTRRASGPAPVELGTAADFAVLAQSAISERAHVGHHGRPRTEPSCGELRHRLYLTRAGHSWTSPEVTGASLPPTMIRRRPPI